MQPANHTEVVHTMNRTVCKGYSSWRPVQWILLVAMLVGTLPACIIVVEEDDDYEEDYYRRRWHLEVVVYSGRSYYASPGSNYTLTFGTSNLMVGQADCVDFEGRYEVGRTSTLTIQGVDATEALCGEESMAPMYLDGLHQARMISGNKDELIITYGETDNELRFQAY